MSTDCCLQYSAWILTAAETWGASVAVEHFLATQVERKARASLAMPALQRQALSHQGEWQPAPAIGSPGAYSVSIHRQALTQRGCVAYAEKDWIDATVGIEKPLAEQ
jgi:hypothetical protein